MGDKIKLGGSIGGKVELLRGAADLDNRHLELPHDLKLLKLSSHISLFEDTEPGQGTVYETFKESPIKYEPHFSLNLRWSQPAEVNQPNGGIGAPPAENCIVLGGKAFCSPDRSEFLNLNNINIRNMFPEDLECLTICGNCQLSPSQHIQTISIGLDSIGLDL